ncbi:MAG: HAD-IIA family hydrolase [Clostridia bacterium]|nr:HAD-IIA family hydrolase [Clostridia bacterium]
MAVKNISEIKYWLLDMDGTIYLGDKLIPGALDFLEGIVRRGGKAIFLTNNSSRAPRDYAKKLEALGISACEEDVFTSGDAAAELLKNRFGYGSSCYLMGTPSLEALMTDRGFHLCSEGENADFVLLGFDKTLTYDKIRIACDYINAGVPFFATHPDFLCPTETGFIPDTGSMIKMFEAATGVSPEIAGKPEKAMADAAFSRYGIDPGVTAMVGDRLMTDIAFGNRSDITAVLVLSGETKLEQYEAQNSVRADFIYGSVAEMEAELEKSEG